jgi:hypothetical protein
MIDDGFEAPDLGVQDALPVRSQGEVPPPFIIVACGRPVIRFRDEVEFLELAQQPVQAGRPQAHLAAGSLEDFLHDAVAVTRSIGYRKQNVENLRLQGQQGLDRSGPVRHAAIYIPTSSQLAIIVCAFSQEFRRPGGMCFQDALLLIS